MSYATQIIGTLLISGSAFAGDAGPTLEPSPALLSLAGVSTFQLDPDIRISIGSRQKTHGTNGVALCENDSVVPLSALAKIKNVTSVKAAIETSDLGSPKLLFELTDSGGLAKS
jgi:hypothetical protein